MIDGAEVNLSKPPLLLDCDTNAVTSLHESGSIVNRALGHEPAPRADDGKEWEWR